MPSIIAEKQQIAPDVSIADSAVIHAKRITLATGVKIGANVVLEGESIALASDVVIQNDVTIKANTISIGHNSRIEQRTIMQGFAGDTLDEISIGDESLIASDNRIFVAGFYLGDYVKVHNHTLINGRARCLIGHNSWVGQNNILNCEADLRVGNCVGLGIYTSVWTHVYYGDMLEGCRLHNVEPTTIGDDVWVMGAYNVISPGVTIGDKAMILTQSAVSKDVPGNTTWAGTPARDVTAKMGIPFRDVSLQEKFAIMRQYVEDFVQSYPHEQIANGWRLLPTAAGIQEPCDIAFYDVFTDGDIDIKTPCMVITMSDKTVHKDHATTVFDLSQRTYTKRRHPIEIAFLRFMLAYRGRFMPHGNYHLDFPNATHMGE
jgi:acetyltransferase-like isoleucine patch superfamily enzyme